jgi:hypothetical protein
MVGWVINNKLKRTEKKGILSLSTCYICLERVRKISINLWRSSRFLTIPEFKSRALPLYEISQYRGDCEWLSKKDTFPPRTPFCKKVKWMWLRLIVCKFSLVCDIRTWYNESCSRASSILVKPYLSIWLLWSLSQPQNWPAYVVGKQHHSWSNCYCLGVNS